MKKVVLFIIMGILIVLIGFYTIKRVNLNPTFKIGQKIDSLNNVYVFYNGGVSHIDGRQITKDGYNLGLKFQCVEFVKRYYYEYLNHKMPDSYGNAKDFFNHSLNDGDMNIQRDLKQYTNPSISIPKVNDLVVFSGSTVNSFGHVAIISFVDKDEIEIIQQNPGQFGKSRVNYDLTQINNKWQIDNKRIVGWLRK